MASIRSTRTTACIRAGHRRAPVDGFSLIEVVIALAVVGVLAAVAHSAYTEQVMRSARSELQSIVTTAAARQSQFLVDRRRYAGSLAALGITIPASIASKYSVQLVVGDGPPPAYSITATAIGVQARDKCPSLALDNAGNRTPAACW